MKTKGTVIGFLAAALLAATLSASSPASAGPKIRASIQVLVGCTLDGDTLTVNVSAEKKEVDAPDPVITEELVTLEKRIGPQLTMVVPDLYDTSDTAGGGTVNSQQNSNIPDPLVPFGSLPFSFNVDLCDTPNLSLTGAKALGVAAEITISNASARGQMGDKTFFARCKVIGLPSCT